jgi:hypothetical protein
MGVSLICEDIWVTTPIYLRAIMDIEGYYVIAGLIKANQMHT